jgi:hypothetical protein
MLEIRTYTLASPQALERYAAVHWGRHIPTLAAFGILTRHLWQETTGQNPRLIAVMEYGTGINPQAAAKAFMNSPEYQDDMEGFAMEDILDVQSVFVERSVDYSFR